MLFLYSVILVLSAINARQGIDQFAILRPFRRCFSNEEFSECVSPCEPTCRNPESRICSLPCVANCRCKPGFLRNENGACVENCTERSRKPECDENSEFTECGSACEPSCQNPRPMQCSLECIVGCQCKEGFYRTDTNECVAECSNASFNICSENEEFKMCGTACEPSCRNPKPSVCTKQCIINVCQCKRGFFRNSEKKCVAQCDSDMA